MEERDCEVEKKSGESGEKNCQEEIWISTAKAFFP